MIKEKDAINLRGSKTFINGLEQEDMGGVGRRKRKRKMKQLYFSKNRHVFPINTLLSFPLFPFSLSFSLHTAIYIGLCHGLTGYLRLNLNS